MAKKSKTPRNGEGRTCGDCARGELSPEHCNRDYKGNPFVKYCPFSTWARNKRGQNVCLISTPACENFKEKGGIL